MTADTVLLLIIDGVSDRPCPELGNLTPLQAAATPVLDRIAAEGICGIMDTIAPGIRPGSDTSHLSLLGYSPGEYYTGRGPLEAVGTGIMMKPGMIGFRCNYATLDAAGKVSDRRAGRIRDTADLTRAVMDGVDLSDFGIAVMFRSGTGHRAALAFQGRGLGACVSSNDPKKHGLVPPPFRPLRDTPADGKTAEALNSFVRQADAILADHPLNRDRESRGLLPANTILIRGAGEMGDFPPFSERYGLSGSVIAAATLINGIGAAVGLRRVPVKGATGSTTTNLSGKVEAVLAELETQDFVLLNIKGADEAGHDGDAVGKRDFIERIDSAIEPFLSVEGLLIVVCSDHSTPCSIRDHSADPVPLVIRGNGVRTDAVGSFDEIACAGGGLNRIPGSALMPIICDLINRTTKYGA
ncbi:MAG: 2,3-bisphosphoglycerate-independent phosphoglycerate mutase [Methanomicrobiales archaeon]|nr:2,3-bisphosphoglycerate-independent phosphoglycerate mutase [Methanomicrobiales archaeon]NYT20866.1 2,3-bisphosphoglycerate-independent phosphoglycerate mutase [Methanomicrobiales archaeon]TRO42556.1 2,3-bisphosphoglycerate-independent phosphoglycerate mutase [Candidatus Bathyarchaeota archaeon]